MKNSNVFRQLTKGLILAAATFLVGTVAFTGSTQADSKPAPFVTKGVYTPKNDGSGWLNNKAYGALSPRVIQLSHQENPQNNGKLLMTFEKVMTNKQAETENPNFPIYESDDNGKTWQQISSVLPTNHQGDHPSWGFMNCPQLYELPEKIGDMPKGTVVLAGNATPNNFNDPKAATDLEVMKSDDAGKNWHLESSITKAGSSKLLADPVWEPYLMVFNHQLVCYYSDEKDSDGLKPKAQALVHQTTTDGQNWSPIKFDIDPNKVRDSRPGMATLAQLSSDKWVMTYEQKGGQSSGAKLADDPTNFDSADPGTTIAPGGAPYITKLNNSEVAFNNNGQGGRVFIFKDQESLLKGTAHPTRSYTTQTGIGYNRQLLPLANGMLLIANGHETSWKPSRIDIEGIDVGDQPQTGGNVTIHYVDQAGKKVAQDAITNGGQIGTGYDVTDQTKKELSGYTLKGVTAGRQALKGNFGADPIEITVTYQSASPSGGGSAVVTPSSSSSSTTNSSSSSVTSSTSSSVMSSSTNATESSASQSDTNS